MIVAKGRGRGAGGDVAEGTQRPAGGVEPPVTRPPGPASAFS